ncbi:CoA transferase [Acinetobacter baumannii]
MTTALNGLKVLDFSTLLPGPFATMYLADMGQKSSILNLHHVQTSFGLCRPMQMGRRLHIVI